MRIYIDLSVDEWQDIKRASSTADESVDAFVKEAVLTRVWAVQQKKKMKGVE